jgi:hypothetical protein
MTDLGLGIVDRRSVLVVLFTVLLSQVIVGNTLPLDTASVQGLFASLVIFTGFVYTARVSCRTVICLALTLLLIPFSLYSAVRRRSSPPTEQRLRRLRILTRILASAVWRSLVVGVWRPLAIQPEWGWYYDPYHERYREPLLGALGVLDRLLLLAIAYTSTLPQLGTWRVILGAAGIVGLLLVYVATGRFTFVLKDALHKTEEDQERLIRAAGTQPSFPSVVTTRPYNMPDPG